MAITVPVTFPAATMSRPVERAGKLHLLIVDEDAAIRSACCEIATDLGFVPQTVSSVAAARTLLRNHGVDVLLLDLHAPLGEGLALLNEIKSLNPGLAVVVMTAYATVPAAVEAMRTGATDYLTKPFSARELLARVDADIAQRPIVRPILVFLGDYIDRGPDSAGFIAYLIEMQRRFGDRVITLKGNHEAMAVGAIDGEAPLRMWFVGGGEATLESYGGIPPGEFDHHSAIEAALRSGCPRFQHLRCS